MSRFITPTVATTTQQTVITTPMTNRCCQFIFSPCLWTVPTGVCCVRVRVWGAGGHGYCVCQPTGAPWCCWWGGFGGGFAMKTLSVTPGTALCAIVGDAPAVNCNCVCINSFAGCVCATSGFTCNAQSAIACCFTGAPGCGVNGDVNYIGGCPTFHNIVCCCHWHINYYPGGAGAANIFGNGGNSVGLRGVGPSGVTDMCSMEMSFLTGAGGSIVVPLPCCMTLKSKAPLEYSGVAGTCKCILPLDIPIDYIGAGVGATSLSPRCDILPISTCINTSNGGEISFVVCTNLAIVYCSPAGYCGTKAGSGGGGAGCFAPGYPGGGGHACCGARGLIIVEW